MEDKGLTGKELFIQNLLEDVGFGEEEDEGAEFEDVKQQEDEKEDGKQGEEGYFDETLYADDGALSPLKILILFWSEYVLSFSVLFYF